MHVVILVRTYPHEVRNGFDAYAYSLIKEYRKEGVDFEVQTANDAKYVDDPKLSPLLYDLLYPMMRALRRRRDRPIFHAISESQGLVFPFLRGRKVVTVHHIDHLRLTPRDMVKVSTLYAMFWRYCTTVAVRHADRIICISEQTRDQLRDMFDLDDDKMVVISQAISDRFAENASMRRKDLVGYIGPFTARKNIPALFTVFDKLMALPGNDQVRLKICGSGPSGPVQEGLSAFPHLADRVIFKGEVPEDDIVAEYNELSALLYPSHQEGFGLGILEAQRCGIPVFIFQDAKIPAEVTRHAIKCTSEDDMAQRLADHLHGKLNYDRQEAMDYAATFSESARARRTISLYQDLVR